MEPTPPANTAALLLAAVVLAAGCGGRSNETPHQRYESAKALFETTTKDFHLASADAGKPDREKLLRQAAEGYERLLKTYPDQSFLAAQALRSLGNVRSAQGRLEEAIQLYGRVEKEYPRQEWEVLQAWKSAADQLWEAKRTAEARPFYQKIVRRFDKAGTSAVIQTVVRGSRTRLAESGGEN